MNGDEPLISILVPCFNRASFVGRTIRSIVEQDFGDWELIAIDDGSTDDSAAVLEQALAAAPDPDRVRFIRRENRGIAKTAGEGLALARGRYFALLDSDDYWYPHKLSRQMAVLSKSGAAGIFSDCDVIDEAGRRIDRMGRIRPYRGGDIYHDVVYSRFMPPSPTWMVERKELVAAGGFHPARPVLDFDAWVRFSRGREIAFVDEPLAAYRVHGGNRSKRLVDQNFESIVETLEDAMTRDPAIARDRRKILSRVRVGLAGSYFNDLDLSRARREALSALATWPFDRAAWRMVLATLAGRRVIELVRRRKRDARAVERER